MSDDDSFFKPSGPSPELIYSNITDDYNFNYINNDREVYTLYSTPSSSRLAMFDKCSNETKENDYFALHINDHPQILPPVFKITQIKRPINKKKGKQNSIESDIIMNIPDNMPHKIGPLTLEERSAKVSKYLYKKRHRKAITKVYLCRSKAAVCRARYKGRFISGATPISAQSSCENAGKCFIISKCL